jgi:hypothetical protein
MDIRQALETEHSKRQTTAIVNYIGDDATRFAELMKIFFAGDYRLTQRSAWPMNYCAEQHPQLIQLYLPKLLKLLQRDDAHDAVKRNIARLLQYVSIPKKLHARVYSLCVELVDNRRVCVIQKVKIVIFRAFLSFFSRHQKLSVTKLR